MSETEFAICECCGFTEEYTEEYIESVRSLYAEKFICGLCSEAVKYEIFRRINDVDEALENHMRFHSEFIASKTVHFISAFGEMFRRRLVHDLPRVTSATPEMDGGGVCAAAVIGGIGSCLPALSGGV